MPNTNKKFKKKINFVFFVNSEKTRHYKLNYNLFKVISALLIVASFSLGAVFIVALNALFTERNLSDYVLNLKNFYIQNYFESHFNKNTQDEINEEAVSPFKMKELAKIGSPHSKELVESAKVEVLDTLKEVNSNTPKPSMSQGNIIVDKIKVDYQDNKLILSFLLLNSHKNKSKPISGSVCAFLEGEGSQGAKKTLYFPDKLDLSSKENLGKSCIKGENVKFNRLRPTKFEFNLKDTAFKTRKIILYFIEKGATEAIIIKDIDFK